MTQHTVQFKTEYRNKFEKKKKNMKTSQQNFNKAGISKPLTLYLPEMKIAEFANSVDLDEVAHDEPPHLHLHSLPSTL